MFRAGLRLLLQSSYPEAVLAETGTAAATMDCAAQSELELVIMDLHLPDQEGTELSRQILARAPATKIIILSGDPNLLYVSEALKAGASAYLLKTSLPEELPRAIATVLEGKLYLCPEAITAALEGYRTALTAPSLPVKRSLSGRELEVVRLIAEGLRTKEIAARLDVGVKTIETYRRRVMKKLSCGGTAELVRYALREGIIQA